MLANQEEDREREAFNLISADRSYQQSRKLIEFALTFSSLDPFACGGLNGRKTSRYTELMRERWVKFAFALTIYLACKPMTVLLVRSIRGRLVGGQNRELIGELDLLLRLTGDSFAYPPLLNSIFYMFIPILGLCFRCYLPVYLKKVDSFDSSLARFILEPTGEIRDFDLQASQIVKDTMEAIECGRRETYNRLRLERDRRIIHAYHIDLLTIQRQLSQMKLVRQQIQHSRPNTLGSNWHKRVCKMTTLMIPSLAVINTFITVVGIIHFAGLGWRSRCNQLEMFASGKHTGEGNFWPNSHLLAAFNFADMLMILEMVLLSVVSIAPPVSVIISFHVLQMYHQLSLTENVGANLRSLLMELRQIDKIEQKSFGGSCLSRQLTGRLFSNLIGLRMFGRETRKCVVMLAHSTRIGVFCLFLFTAVAFVSLKTQSALNRKILLGQVDAITAASSQTDLQFSLIIITIGWLLTLIQQTAVLFTGAVIPARISRLDRTVYSLITELIRIQLNYRNAYDLEWIENREHEHPKDDPITSLWRRLALSRCVEGHLPAVRLLSAALTFERVLELQFYLATVVIMLYPYV